MIILELAGGAGVVTAGEVNSLQSVDHGAEREHQEPLEIGGSWFV